MYIVGNIHKKNRRKVTQKILQVSLAVFIGIVTFWILIAGKAFWEERNVKSAAVPHISSYAGWRVEENKVYYYNPSTFQKHSGWLNDKGFTYYFDPVTKEMTRGLLKLSNQKMYYFDSNGRMYKNCIVNYLVIGEDGIVKEVLLPSNGEGIGEILERQVVSISEKYQADGVSVSVIDNGILTKTFQYGYAVKGKTAMQEDTKIRIASISKVVLSMIALKLQEQGVHDINEEIGKYWGFSIKNPYYKDEAVSLASIFTHTSSISDRASYSNIEGNLRSANIFSNIKPGDPKGCYYCNYAFAVAGATVEKSADKVIDEIADITFFNDLDIDASFASGKIEDPSLLAELYYADGGVGRSLSAQVNYKGNETPGQNGSLVVGALCISAKDMGKLVSILANDGVYEGQRYLEESTVELMETPYCTTDYHGVKVDQCMPLKRNTNIYRQKELYFHTGSAYGVYSLMAYNPQTKNGVVVISTGALGQQDEHGIYSVCGDIAKEVYEVLDEKDDFLKKISDRKESN